MKSNKVGLGLAAVAALLVFSSTIPNTFAQDNCKLPKVLIVLDKSSSMVRTTALGADGNLITKWEAATLAVQSLVTKYGNQIDFGLMVFPNPNECNPGTVGVEVGPDTSDDIGVYLQDPPPYNGNWTPLSQSLDNAGQYTPLQDNSGKSFVLLITDGWQCCYIFPDPEQCVDDQTRFDAVDSVNALLGKGVQTFVLGFGDQVDMWNSNLMAIEGGRAKAGCDPNSPDLDTNPSCYYQTNSQSELEAVFDQIAVEVTEEACDGKDNDCDGNTDNLTPGSTDPLTQTVSKTCGSCTETCVNGQWAGCQAVGVCTDNNACTINDTCVNESCVGTAITCDDTNPCTDDSCDPEPACGLDNSCTIEKVCKHNPNTNSCDDGDPCTTNDVCANSVCIGTPLNSTDCSQAYCKDVNCDDGNPCTDDLCDASLCAASGTCTAETLCKHTPNTLECNDNDPCTEKDICTNGVCKGSAINCDDNNPCTDDVCQPSPGDPCGNSVDEDCTSDDVCKHTPNTGSCDDGDPCTSADKCSNGNCFGGENICPSDNGDSSGCGCSPAGGLDSSSLGMLGMFLGFLGLIKFSRKAR